MHGDSPQRWKSVGLVVAVIVVAAMGLWSAKLGVPRVSPDGLAQQASGPAAAVHASGASSPGFEPSAADESRTDLSERVEVVVPMVARPSLTEVEMRVVYGRLWRRMNDACDALEEATEVLLLGGDSDASRRSSLQMYVSRTAIAEAFAAGRYETTSETSAFEQAQETGRNFQELRVRLDVVVFDGTVVVVKPVAAAHPLQRLADEAPERAMDAVRRHCIDAFNSLPIEARRQMLEADAAVRARRAASGLLHRAEVGETELLRGRFRRSMVAWVLTEH